jgi:hypothetical protein
MTIGSSKFFNTKEHFMSRDAHVGRTRCWLKEGGKSLVNCSVLHKSNKNFEEKIAEYSQVSCCYYDKTKEREKT